jgi:hypothetical protein
MSGNILFLYRTNLEHVYTGFFIDGKTHKLVEGGFGFSEYVTTE